VAPPAATVAVTLHADLTWLGAGAAPWQRHPGTHMPDTDDGTDDSASTGGMRQPNEGLLGHAQVALQEARLVPQQVLGDVLVTGVVRDVG
jgi:hypothetical protein